MGRKTFYWKSPKKREPGFFIYAGVYQLYQRRLYGLLDRPLRVYACVGPRFDDLDLIINSLGETKINSIRVLGSSGEFQYTCNPKHASSHEDIISKLNQEGVTMHELAAAETERVAPSQRKFLGEEILRIFSVFLESRD